MKVSIFDVNIVQKVNSKRMSVLHDNVEKRRCKVCY